MLKYELTPNGAGVALWGDAETIHRLWELIHFLIDHSHIKKHTYSFIGELAYELGKAHSGYRLTNKYQYAVDNSYNLVGCKLSWPLLLIQLAIFRDIMSHIEVDKGQLALMSELEFTIELALKEAAPTEWKAIIAASQQAACEDFEYVAELIDARCDYFFSLPADQKVEGLQVVLMSFNKWWVKKASSRNVRKMLKAMDSATPTEAESINW